MGEFQSNLHTATQLATKMRNASDRMQSATSRSINKATRTTLSCELQGTRSKSTKFTDHETILYCFSTNN